MSTITDPHGLPGISHDIPFFIGPCDLLIKIYGIAFSNFYTAIHDDLVYLLICWHSCFFLCPYDWYIVALLICLVVVQVWLFFFLWWQSNLWLLSHLWMTNRVVGFCVPQFLWMVSRGLWTLQKHWGVHLLSLLPFSFSYHKAWYVWAWSYFINGFEPT